MKKIVAITLALLLLLVLGFSTVLAGTGQPDVGYRPIDTSCGIFAGDYGFFTTNTWWWAVYPNGGGVLKCTSHLNPGQTPPAVLTIIPGPACNTPTGITNDSFTKVFPDGHVVLICRK
jgi:hypothetical protein